MNKRYVIPPLLGCIRPQCVHYKEIKQPVRSHSQKIPIGVKGLLSMKKISTNSKIHRRISIDKHNEIEASTEFCIDPIEQPCEESVDNLCVKTVKMNLISRGKNEKSITKIIVKNEYSKKGNEPQSTENKKVKKKKKKKDFTQIGQMRPENLDIEKKLFFEQEGNYNPNFIYHIPKLTLFQDKPHDQQLKIAVQILEAVLNEQGNDLNKMEMKAGKILSQEETSQFYTKQIKDLELEECLTYEFQMNTIVPTCVVHGEICSKVIIGLPILQRENRIQGVLDHEIGTHFLRKFNDKLQPWQKKRNKFNLKHQIVTEEGLAAINQCLDQIINNSGKPQLQNAALHQCSAQQSSQMSFSQLYAWLGRQINDPSKRWTECLRVKRGIKDTSEPIGMQKDQIYLRGAIEILENRKKINFCDLHSGKLWVFDCIRLSEMGNQIKKPIFLRNFQNYLEMIDIIAKTNFIEAL